MVAYVQPKFEPVQKVITSLNGGVNYQAPASKITDPQFADLLNLQYYISLLRRDTGYVAFNQTIRGPGRKVYQFLHTDGTIEQILITNVTVYRNVLGQWQYVSDGTNAGTTLTAPTTAGNNVFHVAAMNFSVNDYAGITLDNGTQLLSKVTGVNGGALTITTQDNVPAGRTANNAAVVVRAPLLAGVDDFFISALTWAPLNYLIFTNGVDHVKYYDGTNVKDLVGWSATVDSCRSLIAFHGFLIALDTTEGGNRFPQRTRWTDQGNPNVLAGGLSGFVDLIDTEDFILNALLLGPWMIIYRGNSVMRRSYIGDPLQLFFDEYMLHSTETESVGAIGPGAMCSVDSSHIFVTPSGIFRYTGGYDVESVGDNIFDNLLGPTGNLNTNAAATIFMLHVAELDEVWLFVPTDANVYPNVLFRYDQGDDSWWVRKFNALLTAADKITTFTASKMWNTANIQWSADLSPWGARSGGVGAPLISLCDATANQVWLYDYQSSSDGGVAIGFSFTTKDYEVISKKIRFDGFYAKGTGNGVLVEISVDRGQSFQTIGTMNFGSTFSQQNVNMQLAVDVFRLRVSGSDPAFTIDWYRVDYYEETPW